VAENTICGTQQAGWKERLRGKTVLEENILAVPFTTSGIQRQLCIDFISNLPNDKRVEQDASTCYKIAFMLTALFFLMFGPNVLHCHSGPLTHISHFIPISMHRFTVRVLICFVLYLHYPC
jgi:hypothetical protein